MMIFSIISSLLWWAIIIYIIVKLVSGGRRKHYRWLQQQIPSWEEKNIINREQGSAILGFYKLKRMMPKKRMDMVKVLTLIGVIFVELGVIFFVASNWQRIPSYIRTILILSVTIATLYAGYFISYEKKGYFHLGKNLLLLSTLFWGATLALIGQIYNIPTSQNWFIMWLWAFPIIPIAIFFKNDYVHILTSVLFLIWNFLYTVNNSVANYYYPVIIFAIILPTAKNLLISRRINIIGLVAASLYCCFNKYEWLALFISMGLLAYYLAQKQERVYLYTACLSSVFWTITYFTVRQQQPNFYFLLPMGFMIYLTYRDNLGENLVMSLIGLVIWINLSVYSISQLLGYQYNALNFTTFQSLLGIVIFITGIISQSRKYLFSTIYKILGYLITFICIYLLSFRAAQETWQGPAERVYFSSSLFIAAIIALLLYDRAKSGYFKHKAARLELLALVAALMGSIILLTNPNTVFLNTILINGVLIVFALSNIFLGVQIKKPQIFTTGIFIFILFIITRYIDMTWKLKEKSLFFIVGGFVILSLGIFLEKQRRKIIERMKENE